LVYNWALKKGLQIVLFYPYPLLHIDQSMVLRIPQVSIYIYKTLKCEIRSKKYYINDIDLFKKSLIVEKTSLFINFNFLYISLNLYLLLKVIKIYNYEAVEINRD
jgi:hypothetical protein